MCTDKNDDNNAILAKGQNEIPDMLSQMRDAREEATPVFTDFVNYKNFHGSHVFCFYEGEDGYYYDPRVKEYLGTDKFITLIAKNKKKVLRVMELIQRNEIYNNVRTMFFVDHDFDESQPLNKDLFETEGYSIENYYVGEEVFLRILRTAFHINEGNPDQEKCIRLYRKTFAQFHKIMAAFNARVQFKHTISPDGIDCSFGNYNNNRLVQISLGSVVKKDEYEELLKDIDNRLDADAKKLKKIKNALEKEQNPFMVFRGKNELHCFQKFLQLLKEAYNGTANESTVLELQSNNNGIKVNFDPMNHPLGTLSQYANTTQKLIDFIVAHR